MRILIADDDPVSRDILQANLEACGHEVQVCKNGHEAHEALQSPLAPRLIILDWVMPEMDGIEVCRRIRSMESNTYRYVIMLSVKGTESDIEEGYAAGADDYLIKPLNKTDLLHRIRVATRMLHYETELSATSAQVMEYAHDMENLAAERARQLVFADRMITLGTLSAGIAHEINNPTAFISGNIQTLERAWSIVSQRLQEAGIAEWSDPELQLILREHPAMLSGVRKGVERITRIVNGLKSFARQEEPQRTPFQIQDAVDDALELCQNALKYTISIDRCIPEGLPAVLGDKRQVEQVLVNLFTNAADAMAQREQGSLRITADSQGDMLRLSVSDTGTGLESKILDHLFDPFFTTKEEGKGMGLGLSISRGIVEEHGGTMVAKNNADAGAEFTFTLPMQKTGKQEHPS